MAPRLGPRPWELGKATGWFPTRDGRPVLSLDAGDANAKASGKTGLSAWEVHVLSLGGSGAVDLLGRCSAGRALAQGVGAGADLAYWARALRFAASLVARQRFLPGLIPADGQEGRGRAAWRAVLLGPDSERLVRLAERMPPSARALVEGDGASRAPSEPAVSVLSDFISGAVDSLVRTAAMAAGSALSPGPPAFDSPHDAWLWALRAPDGEVLARAPEVRRLALDLEQWHLPLAATERAPFRLCFRLEEPAQDGARAGAEGAGPGATTAAEGEHPEPRGKSAGSGGKRAKPPAHPGWCVRLLLQARDDPSLLLPVSEAWRRRGLRTLLAEREDWDPAEYVLTALGQAAALCPGVASALERPSVLAFPGTDGYTLDAQGAYGFLTESALALEEAGFGVILPAWWTGKGTKARLAVRARVRSPGAKARLAAGFSLDDLVDVRWSAVLGDAELDPRELAALARAKAPLVRLRGQWVQLDPSELQAAARFWQTRAAGKLSVREVVGLVTGAAQTPVGFEVDGVEATGWVKELLTRLDGKTGFGELPPPAGLAGRLRPYQERGYSWLSFLRQWGLGACLADDMGLGKTIQTLALIQRDWEAAAAGMSAGEGDGPVSAAVPAGPAPVLIVCPTSVIDNWRREAARFTPGLPVLVHHGPEREKGAAFEEAARRSAMVVTSYSLLVRDARLLQEIHWAGVVLDEAQNIKNPHTKQARAARSLGAGYRVALTGTPVENHVGELWSLMEFLNPGLLGSEGRFQREFLVPIHAERDEGAARRLRRVTGPFILRRVKTDRSIISDLPPKQETKVFCRLTREQATLYAAVLRDMEDGLGSAEGMERRGLILATLTKLKQVCNHPAHLLGDNSPPAGRSGKLARLTELLEEVLEAGERALVFTQFADMGMILQRYLRGAFGREVLFLHGGLPRPRRDEMVRRFQGEAGPAVFVLSLKAGGTGLNLTAANHVFHFDRWWNPAVEDQATDRVFRIGQTRGVLVHKFVCAGTLEERIDELLERKREVAGAVVGTGEAWLTELSDRQLRELFALSREAVEEP